MEYKHYYFWLQYNHNINVINKTANIFKYTSLSIIPFLHTIET